MMFSYKHVRKVDQGPLSFLFVNHCRKLWTTLFILNSAVFSFNHQAYNLCNFILRSYNTMVFFSFQFAFSYI